MYLVLIGRNRIILEKNKEILDKVLYDGSQETVRQGIMTYITIFLEKSLSKAAFGEILQATSNILPQPNFLPTSYSQVKSLLSHELISVEKIHVCVNDCMLFRGGSINLESCNLCGEGRYKQSDALGRRYPKRSFSYASLRESLELYFGCSNIAQFMQGLGGGGMHIPNGMLNDITETAKWREWTDTEDNTPTIILGMNTDGINPYHSQGIQYSMWPLILTIMNLPKHIRNKEKGFILSAVVPSRNPRVYGGGLEPKLDVYVQLLVDELIALSSFELFSAYSQAPITVKCRLLIFMMDFQGYAKFFHMLGANSYYPCNVCTVKAQRIQSKMAALRHTAANAGCCTRSYADEVCNYIDNTFSSAISPRYLHCNQFIPTLQSCNLSVSCELSDLACALLNVPIVSIILKVRLQPADFPPFYF